MSHSTNLDFHGLLSNAASHVFATMLSMDLKDAPDAEYTTNGEERVVASVGFGGDGIAGRLSLNVTSEFSKTISAAMLGLERDEIEVPADVNDVLGELANVIGGNCLAALHDQGYLCALSLPSVTRGISLQTNTARGAKHTQVSFDHGQDRFFVSLDFKCG
ncbi:MAG: chemotaxis protein CheX [Verrucomicrobia bacterium]|nr:chemotaxis protein CheX [Verrucomicrobiota bacterium]